MGSWRCMRERHGWRLERSADGLARIVSASGATSAPVSIGKAIADFAVATRGKRTASEVCVICVHGLMGEREDFSILLPAFIDTGWTIEHFRYASHAKSFAINAKLLAALIKAKSKASERLCLVGHSFGCRLIAAALALSNAPTADLIFIAPPVSEVRWAKIGAALPPVRAFLGASIQVMADTALNDQALDRHRLLVIEGSKGGSGDGWLHTDETQVAGPHERRTIKASHSRLLLAPQTADAIKAFMRL